MSYRVICDNCGLETKEQKDASTPVNWRRLDLTKRYTVRYTEYEEHFLTCSPRCRTELLNKHLEVAASGKDHVITKIYLP